MVRSKTSEVSLVSNWSEDAIKKLVPYNDHLAILSGIGLYNIPITCQHFLPLKLKIVGFEYGLSKLCLKGEDKNYKRNVSTSTVAQIAVLITFGERGCGCLMYV